MRQLWGRPQADARDVCMRPQNVNSKTKLFCTFKDKFVYRGGKMPTYKMYVKIACPTFILHMFQL